MVRPQRYKSPRGLRNPLWLTSPYIGDSYIIKPGDFFGASLQFDVIAVKGPVKASWISGYDGQKPPDFRRCLLCRLDTRSLQLVRQIIIAVGPLGLHAGGPLAARISQHLTITTLFSFLRLGAPLQLYFTYRSLSLIPGKNTRAADVFTTGLRIPAKFW